MIPPLLVQIAQFAEGTVTPPLIHNATWHSNREFKHGRELKLFKQWKEGIFTEVRQEWKNTAGGSFTCCDRWPSSELHREVKPFHRQSPGPGSQSANTASSLHGQTEGQINGSLALRNPGAEPELLSVFQNDSNTTEG